MRKVGTNTVYNIGVPEIEQFPYLKEIGFDSVMIGFFVGDNAAAMTDAARRADLEVTNIHAPISTVNSMWTESADGEDYIDLQKERIDFCHYAEISTLVLHTTFLKNPPPVSDIGIERHKRLCAYAEDKGVHLAYERVDRIRRMFD